jgi:RNA polymerase sigma-70 factor, ECF subfamily
MTSDERLMLDFQRGVSAAFTELFERYRQPIYGFFRRRLNDGTRAEELAQETFLAVLHGLERYEPRASVRSYLYGIAFKQLAAERRKRWREIAQPVEPADTTREHSPDDALWVRQAVERLEADDREVVLLREYEQLSYAEIAALLRVPINTVRSRLFRARMALKELLLSQRRAAPG